MKLEAVRGQASVRSIHLGRAEENRIIDTATIGKVVVRARIESRGDLYDVGKGQSPDLQWRLPVSDSCTMRVTLAPCN